MTFSDAFFLGALRVKMKAFYCVFQGKFVAAFGQSNEGDVSPNTKGAHCLDTGKPCEFNHSTCGGKVSIAVT